MNGIKKIHIFIIFLLALPSISVSAADTVPLLVPSLQAQMIRQDKINKKNMIAERIALKVKQRQDGLTKKSTTAYATITPRRFILVGVNEVERQKYLLNHYATLDFQDWQLWINTAIAGKVDPSFMMCVGLAESTLGKYLKTPYNIGNVGNTDSGGTYSFTSPAEGLTWMTNTFNNRYLGKYTKVSELSRWGNPDGMIYASSPSNWHNNTIKCLSELKGQGVPDDYNFRVP